MKPIDIEKILASAEEESRQYSNLALLASQSREKAEDHEKALKVSRQKSVATCNRYLLHNATNVMRELITESLRLQKLLFDVSRVEYYCFLNDEEDWIFIDLVAPTPVPEPDRDNLRGWIIPIGGSTRPTSTYHIALQVPTKGKVIHWEEAEVCYAEEEVNSNPMYTRWSKEFTEFFEDSALLLGLLQLQTEGTSLLYLWEKFGAHRVPDTAY